MSNSEYQAIIHNLFQFRVHCLWTDGHACNMSLQGCTHVCDREGCICPDSQWKDSSIYGWLMQNQQGEKQCADTFPDSRRHYASRWKRPRLFLDWHFIVNCIVTCKFVQAINSISAGMLVRQQNMIITPRSSPLCWEERWESNDNEAMDCAIPSTLPPCLLWFFIPPSFSLCLTLSFPCKATLSLSFHTPGIMTSALTSGLHQPCVFFHVEKGLWIFNHWCRRLGRCSLKIPLGDPQGTDERVLLLLLTSAFSVYKYIEIDCLASCDESLAHTKWSNLTSAILWRHGGKNSFLGKMPESLFIRQCPFK